MADDELRDAIAARFVEPVRIAERGPLLRRDHAIGDQLKDLGSMDLRTMTAGMKFMGIDAQACKSLEQAKQLAYRFITNRLWPKFGANLG